MTIPGELARVTGLSRPEAGRGNRALVAEGYATMPGPGVYRLAATSLSSRATIEISSSSPASIVEANPTRTPPRRL